jgi:hypothetical protein
VYNISFEMETVMGIDETMMDYISYTNFNGPEGIDEYHYAYEQAMSARAEEMEMYYEFG